MELHTVWFILIAVLWIGYFALEGFDFGVGMLLPILAKNDKDRRVMINTIGPVWDGNEVWVLTAGGATFAAFPYWYSTLFSGFYLPLLLILLALIVRGLAFEYRHQRPEASWHSWWDRAIVVGSFVPALLWGVAFANIVRGVPLEPIEGNDAAPYVDFTGTLFTLLNPFGLLGGLVTLGLFLTHGAMFLALKTDGDIRQRAREFAVRSGLVTAVLAVAFLIWTQVKTGDAASAVFFALAALALVGALAAAYKAREGWAFIGTFACLAFAVAGLFFALFPDVMPSTIEAATNSLRVDNAAASDHTLTVMTIVAAIFTPIVLCYQAWSFWIFRKRISGHHIPDAELEAVA
jgi:cytochrome d ubiquinol oxidase subunit II